MGSHLYRITVTWPRGVDENPKGQAIGLYLMQGCRSWGCLKEPQAATTREYSGGYVGIMEKKMEATSYYLGFRV